MKRRPPVAASCLVEDGFDDRLAWRGPRRAWGVLALGLEVIDVEAQDVPVLDGVGDGVGVELLLEEVLRGLHGGLRVLDLLLRRHLPRRWACR